IRFKTPIKIILVAQQTIQIIENVSELLPLSFQKDNLFE
ncbi:MAG TPA: cytidine deaminase, partial [Marinilabiliales bacterium]|nr:cytidine deaminase [Marinilabiliales bacterium]